MATATATQSNNPKSSSELNSKLPADEDASVAAASTSPVGDESAVHIHDIGAVTDIRKKTKRAERFGLPVHLTEEEKRNSRAERFGTGSGDNGLSTFKTLDEVKKKARAERFGIVQPDASDNEAKKKARLARFGSTPKTDSVEEDKKKARAIRFSQPDSDSKNGKGNVEVKINIASKADGGT